MAINVQQGTPGSGKSAVAVARAIAHLRRGGVVAANFRLVDGWAAKCASMDKLCIVLRVLSLVLPWFFRTLYHARFNSLASSFHSRFSYVSSVTAIMSLKPKESAVWFEKTVKGKYQEGQGLLLLDECQLIFNSRKYEKNFKWIEFFTQHRKLGWDVILIAHDIEMIDKQIRPLCEYESRFRNLQKVRVPLLGLPLSPIPFFVVITRYAGLGAGASTVHSRAGFPLPLWAAQLYDSCLVFSAETWQEETLPEFCGPAPVPLCGAGVGASPVRRSSLVGPHWDSYVQTISQCSPPCSPVFMEGPSSSIRQSSEA